MSNFSKYSLGIILFIFSINAFTLEIDEKLTLRFLKVSNSKKTVLINRGSEDGLVVGDHAKFFITSGIVARGLVEKVSPSRSIWSLYRVVAPDEITDNKVLNLKIASPVKVTGDMSKSLKDENIPVSKSSENESKDNSDLNNNLNEKSNDKLGDEDKKELEDLGIQDKKNNSNNASEKETFNKKASNQSNKKSIETSSNISNEEIEISNSNSNNSTHTMELFGTLAINSQSGTTTDASSNSVSAQASTTDFAIGLEKYFFNNYGIVKELSLIAFLNRRSSDLSVVSVPGTDSRINSTWIEYGVGANYHYYNSAATINHLIGYALISGGMGTNTSSVTFTDLPTGNTTTTQVNGSRNFFSIGTGAKYILANQFGIRFILDYYISKESYLFSNGSTVNRSLNGPRIMSGISWRF